MNGAASDGQRRALLGGLAEQDPTALDAARYQGQRLAQITIRLAGDRAAGRTTAALSA